MTSQKTLPQTRALALVTIVIGLTAWSCSTKAPSGPTDVASPQVFAESMVENRATARVVSWECLTATRAGVLSTGSCGAPVHAASLVGAAAVSAPNTPSNLTSTVNGNSVSLTWIAPGFGDAATSYLLEAGSFPGGSNLASFDTGNGATRLTAADVPSGTYYVRVRARNGAGTSAPSNEIVVTVGSATPCATAPSAPSGLSASVNGSSVTLNWFAPGGGCAPTGYILEAGSFPGANDLANVSTGSTATSFATSGIGGGTYYVRVRAASAAGVSLVSNEIVVVVAGQRECSQRIGPFATQDTAFRRRAEAQAAGVSVSGVFPCFDEFGTRGYCFNVFLPC